MFILKRNPINKIRNLIFIISLLISFSAQAQLSGTYIIGGPNGNYATVGIAIQDLSQNGLSGPVVFEVYPGTYYVKETIPFITGCSAQNTITFVSQTQNADDVEFYNTSNDENSSFILLLNGVKYISFKYITFTQKGSTAGCLLFSQLGGELLISNCRFGAPFCDIISKQSIIPLVGVPALSQFSIIGKIEIENNIFNRGIKGIFIFPPAFLNNSFTINIYNNTLINLRNAFELRDYDSLYFNNNYISCYRENVCIGDYVYFNNNSIYSTVNNPQNPTVALSMISNLTGNSSFCNNMIVSNNPEVFSVGAYNLLVSNNTILSTGHFENPPIKIENNINLIFKNNILVNSAANRLMEIRNNTNSVFDYNVYYTTNDTIFFDGNATAYTSLSLWQTATGYDTHSVFVNPNFSKSNDIHLQANNPQIIEAGTPLVLVVKDIDGENRDALHPDIGADEYSLRPIIDSVVWGCAGSVVTLDAGAGFSSYHWSNNATSQTITVDTNGVGIGQQSYSVTVTYGGNSATATVRVIWQDCTSLLDYQKEKFDLKLFPNPTTGFMHIDISDVIQDFEVRVYNANGALIMQTKNTKQISLSNYSKGLYFIQIVTNEASVLRKIVLE